MTHLLLLLLNRILWTTPVSEFSAESCCETFLRLEFSRCSGTSDLRLAEDGFSDLSLVNPASSCNSLFSLGAASQKRQEIEQYQQDSDGNSSLAQAWNFTFEGGKTTFILLSALLLQNLKIYGKTVERHGATEATYPCVIPGSLVASI